MPNIMQAGCAPAATCTRANTVLRPACVRSLKCYTVHLVLARPSGLLLSTCTFAPIT